MSEEAWVIEGGWSPVSEPDYWVGPSTWSSDPYKALRFACRESAQQACDLMCAGLDIRICCHSFAQEKERARIAELEREVEIKERENRHLQSVVNDLRVGVQMKRTAKPTERKRFEMWVRRNPVTRKWWSLDRYDHDQTYSDPYTDCGWMAWQAAKRDARRAKE